MNRDVNDFSQESQSFSGDAVAVIVAEYSNAIAAQGSAASSISHDGVLERLFSALAQLPDLALILLETETRPVSQANPGSVAESTPVVDSLAFLIPDAISCALYGSPESPRFLLPGFHEVAPVVATQDRVALSEWTDGLRLASSLCSRLSPTELHATALSSVAFGNSDSDSENTAFSLTCLLVCCEALRRCNLLDSDGAHKRWKRWQCMQLETLQLFQRIALIPAERSSSSNGFATRATTTGPAAWAVSVWCSYVLPAVAHVQQALFTAGPSEPQPQPQHNPSSDNPRWMLYEAGAVACAARLAAIPTYLAMMEVSSVRLLESLNEQNVLDGSWTILYEHPMRKRALASINRSKKPSFSCPQNAALARFTIASERHYHSDYDSDDDDDLYNLTLGVETQWSDLGVARLAILTGWKVRPRVWSIEYQWYLFLPHMNQLLLGEGNDADDADEDEGDGHAIEEKRQRNESIKSSAIHAFSVLRQLLQGTPQYSMSWTKSTARNDYLGLFQLLANYMIAANMSQSQSSIGHDETSTTLPNATETFQVMKGLLEKFRPQCQVGLVRRLLEDCPHPGLRPKLIDLLRNFVFWEDAASEDNVWALVADICLRDFDGLQSTALSANEVSRHIDNVEDYQAALGLLEVWIMRKRSLPLSLYLEDLRSRIQHSHTIVSTAAAIALAAGDEQNGDSLPGHRFNLLESALQRALALMASIPDKASLDA